MAVAKFAYQKRKLFRAGDAQSRLFQKRSPSSMMVVTSPLVKTDAGWLAGWALCLGWSGSTYICVAEWNRNTFSSAYKQFPKLMLHLTRAVYVYSQGMLYVSAGFQAFLLGKVSGGTTLFPRVSSSWSLWATPSWWYSIHMGHLV